MKIQSLPLALAGRMPLAIIGVALWLVCSAALKPQQPTELQKPVMALVSARQSWTQRIGPVTIDVASPASASVRRADDGRSRCLIPATGRDVHATGIE
jgi:hypothetical protein